MKKHILVIQFILITIVSYSQNINKTMLRLPDTGETTSYTNTFGEDNDYTINPPFFLLNGNGTVTDTVTGLIWQQTDGGEMTIENAHQYCDTLTLGGYNDWRLPTAHESFSILNQQFANPALDNSVFITTDAEYWWTGTFQINDSSKVWVTNAGGGIGNHPKSETISAGGNKKFHVRAVRDINIPSLIPNHFTDNGDGTVTDNLTNLVWSKYPFGDSLTWEDALVDADSFSLAGFSDWRMPNIKELQSINDESLTNPSINTNYFAATTANKYWSSTTLPNQTTKAWYLNTLFGITTYDYKSFRHYLICVRGNGETTSSIKDISNTFSVSEIYPNPFSSLINLKSKNGNEYFKLTNCYGEIIYSGKNIDQQNFSSLTNGIYFLKIIDNTTSVIKLMKE